ncbi:MAG: DNA repair protein RecN [Ruminococcaceae bacterium]|nr:DNA repair protein RecN [Oscillospiraceae bacterium]
MLRALHIENAALIRRLDIDFSAGFTVFTGETGAGKSIIIGSLGLLTGARADKELIRTGEDKAVVSGLFLIEDNEIIRQLAEIGAEPDENGEMILSRTVSLDGRSTCRINGRSVSLSLLRSVGQILIAIHGQHDTKSLLDPESHLPVLDRFAGNEEAKNEYHALYREIQQVKGKLSQLIKEKAETKRLSELLQREAKEIDQVSPKIGEIEALEQKRKFLQSARQLRKQANTVVHALYKNEKGVSASDLVGYAINAINAMGEAFPERDKALEKLTEFQLEMENIADSAASLASLAEEDPDAALHMIDDRLASIRILQKKYGATVEEILSHKESCKEKLDRLEKSEGIESGLRIQLEELVLKAREKAIALHNTRENAAEKLRKTVSELLAYLDLGKVQFETPVKLQYNDKNVLMLGSEGADIFEFLISANIGEPPRPIAKIASGGELSRIMLALKTALADSEETPTLIFDEIDTGISGKTSQKIGFLMKRISDATQILCVTHSAQLASSAANHFKIAKAENEGRTETSITELDEQGRIDELARILGGVEITETVRQNARELLRYQTTI